MDHDPDALGALMRGAPSENGELLEGLPFSKELGMRLMNSGDGQALLSIPYAEHLVGDPETGVISGGAVTAILDTCGGVAVMAATSKPLSVATLDLRIDYMRPATPQRALFAHAECFRETRSIVFVRASAFHDAPDTPVATAIGAFMVERRPEKEGAK